MALEVGRLDLRMRRRMLAGCVLGMAAYAVLVVALYPAFKNDAGLNQMTRDNPTMTALFGASGSLTSPAGWLNANLYANFVPLIALLLTIGYGAAAIAGQNEDGSLGLTATLPIGRTGLLGQKMLTLACLSASIPLATLMCLCLGPAFGLHPSWSGALAITVTTALLAFDLGLLGLVVGAVARSRGAAIGVATAAAAASYLISSLAPAVHWVHSIRWLSPFYWAVGAEQLSGGGRLWLELLTLTGLAAVLSGVGIRAVERVDIR